MIGSVVGQDRTPITRDMKPADILAAMRANGAGDLEVSFVAMRFIIQSAIKIVKEAMGDVKDVQIPEWYWLCMPWKVAHQNEVGERLQGHFDALDKFNVQLQSAISIASYCVSLEQLENVLNATNILASLRIREFWKKKVGISNSRVKMTELAESFMSEVDTLLVEYKKEQRSFPERIIKGHGSSEVALNRFLSYLWNGNGDEIATVYEVNNATEKYVRTFGPKVDTIKLTFQKMLEIQNDFFSKIEFIPLKANAGKDRQEGTDDDQLVYSDSSQLPSNNDAFSGVDLNPSDKVIVLKPFHRLRVVCTVPQFEPEIFCYDFVALLKYDKVNTLKQLVKSSTDLVLEEVAGSRTYVVSETNQDFYGDDQYKWNAPKAFKDKLGKEQKIPVGFKKGGKSNFESNKIAVVAADDEAVVKKDDAVTAPGTLETGGVTTTTTILYSPIVSDPGVYTVRYCLNDLTLDEKDTPGAVNKKKLALAPRTYYYNRLLSQTNLDEKFKSKIITADVGFGDSNFKPYAIIALKSLELDNAIAKVNRDLPTLKRINREKSRLQAAIGDKEAEAASIKLVTPTLSQVPAPAALSAPPSPLPSSNSFKDVDPGEFGVKMVGNPMTRYKSAKLDGKAYEVTPLLERIDFLGKGILYPPAKTSDVKGSSTSNNEAPSKETDKLRNFLLDTQKKIRSQLATKYLDLLNTEIAVNKLALAVELSSLIDRINAYLEGTLKNWKASINADAIDAKKLTESDNTVKLLKALEVFRKTLIPPELSLDLPDTPQQVNLSPPVTSASEKRLEAKKEEKEKKSSYLVDPENDHTDEAKDYLSDRLFLQYYNTKLAILELDATESISQKNIRRLEMLQEVIRKLQKAKDEKLQLIVTANVSGPDGKAKRGSVCSGENYKVIDHSVAMDLLLSGKDKKATTRASAIQQVDNLVRDINDFIDALLETASDPRKKNLYTQNLEAVKQIVKVLEELENYREEAKYLPQYGYPTTEEELKLAKHLVHSPYGLIVLVEDVNALAWGERANADSDDDVDEKDSLTTWRPMIEYRYPYNPKAVLKLRKHNYDFDNVNEDDKKQLTYAVYYNVVTKRKNKAADVAGDKTAVAAVEEAAEKGGEEKISPDHFGVFVGDRLLGAAISVDKNSNFKEVDFYSLIASDADVRSLDIIELAVHFLLPVAAGETPSEKLPGGPVLTVMVSDDLDEYDESDDEDGYYDDDDDEDNGGDDDDEDDYDYEYEEWLVNNRAEQATVAAPHLPDKVEISAHEEHPLVKLEEVYGGSYGCNICGKNGQGWVYHCDEDYFDAHPQCAVWNFDEYYEKAAEEGTGEQNEGEEEEGEGEEEEEEEEKEEE